MTGEQILQLVTTGGGVAVLAIVVALLLRGDLHTRGAVAAVREADAKTLAEVVRDRDEWKAIAREAVTASASAIEDIKDLAEALTVRNRIDEDLRRAGVLTRVAQ